MYATDRKTSSDVRRASSLNSSALWGRDIITLRDRGCVGGGLAVSGCFWFVLRRRRRSPFDLQSRRVFDAISAADRQHQSSVTSNLWCSVDQSWRSLRLYRTLHSASPQPVGQSVGQSPGREQSRLLGTVFASRGGTLHVQRPFVFRHSLCHTCLLWRHVREHPAITLQTFTVFFFFSFFFLSTLLFFYTDFGRIIPI